MTRRVARRLLLIRNAFPGFCQNGRGGVFGVQVDETVPDTDVSSQVLV